MVCLILGIAVFPGVSSARRTRDVAQKNPIFMAPPSERESILILQGSGGVTAPSTGQRYLVTSGLTSCVAVTLYDRETKIGALAHFDRPSDVSSAIRMMIEHMEKNGAGPGRLEARIIHGTHQSDELRDAICLALASAGITVAEIDTSGHDLLWPRSIAFDTETGEVYDVSGLYTTDPLSWEGFVLTEGGLIK